MDFTFVRKAVVLSASLLVLMLATETVLTTSPPRPPLPNPVLFFVGTEYVTIEGKQMIRYNYAVENYESYPDELFAPAPELPPCGKNTKSSRTWVDFYDQSGKRLYGFCSLSKAGNLNGLYFTLEDSVVPPSYVYIELNDRKTNTKYKSNLADTTQ